MVVYAVIRGDGTLKRTRSRSLAIYAAKSSAQRFASAEGDSVVEVTIDLSSRPLFIRGFKIVEGEWVPNG